MASAEPANDTSRNELLNLYDDMNEHFEGNDFDKTTEASELYDAVLTGLVNQDKSVVPNQMQKRPAINTPHEVGRKLPSIDRGEQSTSKHSLYVGNFSWWISDKDLMHMAQSLGVMDIIEIKFAENKINGQSRGYAEVVVASEGSLRTLLDKVPQCKISGENLSCRSATYQNLAFFETLANKRMPMRVKDPKELDSPPPNSVNLNPPPMPLIYPLIPPPNYPPSNPFLNHPPPQPMHIPLNIPQPMVPPFPPPPFHYGQPPPSLHINPAFLPPHTTHNSGAYQPKKNSTQKSDDDFEELMNRNRTITSTAISKAVSDATTGDMHMATETLLTAIAVIKQSRVYEDDCCQALVTSLKDCLVSIRGNYDSRRDRERDRVKERDRNRDREREDSHGKSRRYKERSWSGGRDRNHERDTRERDTRERETRERDTRERNTRERDTRDRNTHERDTRERDPRERDPRDPRERDPRERDPRDPRERDPRDPRERDPRERDPRERDTRERDTRERDRHRDPRDRYR
ncbi:cleavage and polyadenylation specificity factor subunit 7 isoform X1 [Gadus morhua]|uniref:Cleavage and polyadenylation specific factor 7 n=2 Tax=Gadus morhua TaxID=8049 RepID=A0A8C5AZW7_GADMO|nr:cleavage and polyadenylation specificity factor subunit 7-like isoform X1 [Gadus morhua]XP_030233373.1 cleavage and polyadenylation specificity factor subunit 7-like isoform X1 [Gadus morhua]XP_030233374.1 cleavage and polyadenylation specificity factor subunit 7-like isoform X1 [Gadus morhua]XP_030233375.1 cleavage and polyadenylation specificity factor subunit 7-like isoform X1 [Gadus morhua]